jgi:NitT/TauT family transport system substrate-binding protein
MRKHYKFVILIVVFLLTVSCSQQNLAVAEEVEYEPVTVTINDSVNINYGPIILAEKLGYFAEYGIELEKVQFSHVADGIPLLGSGHLDVYAGSITAGFLNVLGQDPNIKVVADRGLVTPDKCTFLGLMIRKDLVESGRVESPEDLAGLEINAVVSSPTGYLLSELIKGTGITIDDISFNNLPESTYIDAFANKTLDGIITPEIKLSRTLNAGNAVLFAAMEDVVGNYQSSALAFGKNLIKDHPDVGVRFMAAYLMGLREYDKGKTEDNLRLLNEYLQEDPELLKQACWVFINPEGTIDFENVAPFMTWAVENGHLDGPITEEQFWDPSFIEKANDLLEN